MALLQGLKQMQKHGIKEARIIGDSQNLIGLIVTKSVPKYLCLQRLFDCINKLIASFDKLQFFHVLQKNNTEADLEANIVVYLLAGSLLCDENIETQVKEFKRFQSCQENTKHLFK